MANGNVKVGRQGARSWLASLALWASILASGVVVGGAIYALVTWIDDTLLNEKIDARIEKKRLDERLKKSQTQIGQLDRLIRDQTESLNRRINDMPSRVNFQFKVRNQSTGPARPAPACPDGWTQKAAFRISHTGGSNGHGGHVRLCMQISPPEG